MTIEVRRATTADLDAVCEFNRLLALESEGKVLDGPTLRSGVQAALADPAKGVYFLALKERELLGQIGLTYEWSDWRHGWFWWLQSVYVRPESRRSGVFRTIFEHIRAAAHADPQVIGLRLYVENDNTAAHATYQGLGLHWTTYRVMELFPLT